MMDEIEFASFERLAEICRSMAERLVELGERMKEAERESSLWAAKAREMASQAGWENSDYLDIEDE